LKTRGHLWPANSGIAIVGPGRIGQAMGKLLAQAGLPVRFVVARRLAAARRGVGFIGCGEPVELRALAWLAARVFLLTTADSALSTLAQDLSNRRGDWAGKVVLHTCGSLPASVLRALRRRGAAIGCLHPYQTVPSPAAGVRNLVGAYWGVEGDAAACQVARRLARALGGVVFRVYPRQKTLYHLSAFLVCPTTLTLLERSMRLLRRAGVPARIARPMLSRFVTETVQNFAELGARRAMTGPAVRGDWSTIERHLRALRRAYPDLIPTYKVLLGAMLRLTGRRPPRQWREVIQA
jgi:predicted short-subunit dehydrogenase-like oxidoreductase (DUF2520 family)